MYQLPKVRKKVNVKHVEDAGADFIVPDSQKAGLSSEAGLERPHS